VRLLAGLQDWVRRDLGRHLATGAPECRYCPLCTAVAVLRGDRPEVTGKLAEAGLALLGAVRAAFDPPAAAGGDPSARPPAGASNGTPGGAAGPRVERIDLD